MKNVCFADFYLDKARIMKNINEDLSFSLPNVDSKCNLLQTFLVH